MSPYQRSPRRHFTHQMMSPYFRTEHYDSEHNKLEKNLEKSIQVFFKTILNKFKK